RLARRVLRAIDGALGPLHRRGIANSRVDPAVHVAIHLLASISAFTSASSYLPRSRFNSLASRFAQSASSWSVRIVVSGLTPRSLTSFIAPFANTALTTRNATLTSKADSQ